ncbi:ribonuclease III [Clostridiaceae bacterium NSJ-31]|uniref:Ribonuclease 3 n=1 Tax=Ligaoa zhengdingensis TaxID=2763658 RepID=A0A926DUI7_9FIRM|nr:ribonuclease III [Ligaoa zhengdingensis]MBC8545530.1 ribonuclease III [Ligaoa zhengdingensis]
MKNLEQKLQYTFRNRKYLEIALTHSSYANETKRGLECNERQEFLGDAVLSIVVSDYLFHHYAHLPEGELTKLRASLVCEKSLCQFAKEIDLGAYLQLGKGEEITGGRERPSILADAFESVIAAIYLDGGMPAATEFVLRFVANVVENHRSPSFKDYKTILQEIIQQNPEEKITYVLVDESGPDHNKEFVVEVHLNSNVIGTGRGRSKKTAEQMAAKEALELMGE